MDWARTVCAPARGGGGEAGLLVHCGLRRVPDFRAVIAQQIIRKCTVYNPINGNVALIERLPIAALRDLRPARSAQCDVDPDAGVIAPLARTANR